MICIICQQVTEIGAAYLLPKIIKDSKGYVNLAACSKEHRAQWQNEQTTPKAVMPMDAGNPPTDEAQP